MRDGLTQFDHGKENCMCGIACPCIASPSSNKGTIVMKTLKMKVIVLALGFAFSAGAMAEGMSNSEYKAEKEKISADYKTAKEACDPLAGNAGDICGAGAKGKEKVAKADLEAAYKPSRKTHYQARVAKAEATYAIAREHCDDLAGNPKDVCIKEAKAEQTNAKADAKARMKTSDANATANEKSADARSIADAKVAEARKDATADKLDAGYDVAKEKCDTYSGTTKDQCLDQAKVRYGK
jgi:hypothetical protein